MAKPFIHFRHTLQKSAYSPSTPTASKKNFTHPRPPTTPEHKPPTNFIQLWAATHQHFPPLGQSLHSATVHSGLPSGSKELVSPRPVFPVPPPAKLERNRILKAAFRPVKEPSDVSPRSHEATTHAK